jgi:phage tail protein X
MAVITTGQFTTYTTLENDRWDSISYICYGTVSLMDTLIQANPNLAINDVLTAGITLNIPTIDISQLVTTTETLPPWKQ